MPHGPNAAPLLTPILRPAPQIEIFTWSASGAIVTEALASAFRTVVLFVVDTPRAAAPVTFMSNMLQVRPLLLRGGADLVHGRLSRAAMQPCT